MALPPIAVATIQAAILSPISNIMAQAIEAYRNDKAFVIDWVPVFQFFLYALTSTPPNYLFQDFLESAFPSTKSTPTAEAISSAATGNEKELDREAKEGRLVEPKLNIGNTVVKFILDQTVGSGVNAFMFSVFTHSIQQAMAHRTTGADASVAFLTSGKALDYSQVNWSKVIQLSQLDFWPIMWAGWKLWPFVSFFNYVVVRDVVVRGLVAAIAGMGWGIYMSMFAAR